MTIIAGFKSWQGIVICADTQETSEHSKRKVSKLRFEPPGGEHGTDSVAAAFCGSGDGPFVDKLIDNAWQNLQTSHSLDEACHDIEASIKQTYQEFGRIYQRGSCPTADLIYGIKMHEGSKLFMASGPIVNEQHAYCSSGIGYYMADFLAGRMYKDHLNLHQCVILAAYILYQAKEHVEGCGGDSQIAALRNEGSSGWVGWKHVEAITELLQFADSDTSEILFSVADLNLGPSRLHKVFVAVENVLSSLRESKRKEVLEAVNRWNAMAVGLGGTPPPAQDFLGLPKSLSSLREPRDEEPGEEKD